MLLGFLLNAQQIPKDHQFLGIQNGMLTADWDLSPTYSNLLTTATAQFADKQCCSQRKIWDLETEGVAML